MKTKLLILALLTAGFAQSQNLIQNGSFEQFTTTIPNSWTVINGSSDKEEVTFSNGLSSLKGFPESSVPFSSPFFWISQDFNLADTETYTLKFDYFVPGDLMSNYVSGIGFEINLNNSAEAFYFPTNYPATPVAYGEWKTATFDFNVLMFKPPATSASFKLTLQARTDVGFTGTHAYFDNVIVAKKSTLSTVDFNKKSNPIELVSNDEIKLNSDYKDASYVIYSIDGKAVKRAKNNSSDTIEISGLAKGVYLLKFDNLSTSVKFIKQ